MIPAWIDRDEYPFTPREHVTETGVMRYLDEGGGAPIVMVHGTPTWSFLYRHLVKGLAGSWRCIVPDLPGFGLSDKPAAVSYRPEDQARRLTALIETLGLKDVTLVVHDFGGPIGLAHAIDRPANVSRLVLFNTWMWSLEGNRQYEWPARLMSSRLGRLLYERLGVAVNMLWRHAVRDPRYTAAIHAQYTAAVRDPAARHATWIYARELLASSAWFDALWQRRERIADVPTLMLWGSKDPAFATALPRWRTVFAHAEVVEWPDVGHAPPEVRGPEAAARIRRFLEAPRRTP